MYMIPEYEVSNILTQKRNWTLTFYAITFYLAGRLFSFLHNSQFNIRSTCPAKIVKIGQPHCGQLAYFQKHHFPHLRSRDLHFRITIWCVHPLNMFQPKKHNSFRQALCKNMPRLLENQRIGILSLLLS